MARWFVNKQGKTPVIDPDGNQQWLSEEKATRLMRESGWQADLSEDTRKALNLPKWNREQILDDPGTALAMGALSSATLGLSDVGVRAAGGEDAGAALAALKQENPWSYGAGELAGALMPGAPASWAMKGAGKLGAAAGARVARGATEGGRALMGGLAGRAVEGLAGGAMLGAGSGLSQAMATGKPIDLVDVGGKMLEGGLVGAALGGGMSVATGALGAGARFVGGKVKGVSKVHRLKVERSALLAEQEAVTGRIDAASRTGRMVANKDTVRLTQIETALGKIDDQLGSGTAQALGGLAESMAQRGVQRVVGSAIGGAVGGPLGFAAGAMLGPAAQNVLGKALQPAYRVAEKVIEKGAAAAERVMPTARLAAKGAGALSKAAPRPLTSLEFREFSSDLDKVNPDVMVGDLLASMPVGLQESQKRAVIAEQQKLVGFFNQVFDEVAPKGGSAFGKLQRRDPGAEGRRKLTRYMHGALNPASLLEDIVHARLTKEVVRANEVLRPAHLQEVRDAVAAEVRANLAQGGRYSMSQERNLATLLGYPPRSAGLGPLWEQVQGQQGSGAPKGKARRMKKQEEPYETRLQKLTEQGLA